MNHFSIHPLLAYSQHNVIPRIFGNPSTCYISWDMRKHPQYAYTIANNEPLTRADLAQLATNPAMSSLQITCGIFPGDWPINVRRPGGITVGDVLHAIHTALTRRISHNEWYELHERERSRITDVFNTRWQAAEDPCACRENGVLRIDCLLQHTIFGGLSVSPTDPASCILSLRRAR